MNDAERRRAYWLANLRFSGILLTVWFAVAFGSGILLRGWLDNFSIGGTPLGFWMAQQGAIYIFVILIFVYAWGMRRLERRYGIGESATEKTDTP